MGLDSVELLVEWEKYFSIQIQDLEAEKISTVQNAVDCISSHLNINENDLTLRNSVFSTLKNQIKLNGMSNKPIELNDLVYKVLEPQKKEIWSELSKSLNLTIPEFSFASNNTFSRKIISKIIWIPGYDYKEITFERLVDTICAENFRKLIDQNNITSKYEIYIIITAITVDKNGIDYYEVTPSKTFHHDFGID
jgi:hypothetical protein